MLLRHRTFHDVDDDRPWCSIPRCVWECVCNSGLPHGKEIPGCGRATDKKNGARVISGGGFCEADFNSWRPQFNLASYTAACYRDNWCGCVHYKWKWVLKDTHAMRDEKHGFQENIT